MLLDEIFGAAHNEVFHDGMDSEFSDKLIIFLGQQGIWGATALTNFIVAEKVSPQSILEALKWIGKIRDPITQRQRRWLLERSLSNLNVIIRDGAILGLSSMDDPSSIPAVERVLKQEENLMLREDMEQLLDQLKETALESA